MQPFTQVNSPMAPLDRANVDTDAILPKQFMKSIRRTGFGINLFDEWRYLDHGEPGQDASTRQVNPEFVLNLARYQGAQVLLTRDNFGCGSSREHAPWALSDFGIRALIAPSFADIFYGNCFKNGILPIVLEAATVQHLFDLAENHPGLRITVNLASQQVIPEGSDAIAFEIDAERKHRLLHGLDDVTLTLQQADRIRAYEQARCIDEPWLFG
ncbi:3-isopropylmalate dehydratase small subunit [Paraburkholderia sp. IMGN_8]|uniref:3-isopropylmalate dehydratase small subunit n=1 Tax=Paraburkholderia sp. IMGN_8 TaxID=3136564 RepID=UPI0031017EB3